MSTYGVRVIANRGNNKTTFLILIIHNTAPFVVKVSSVKNWDNKDKEKVLKYNDFSTILGADGGT